jgi:ornithine carbamoyltransferase
LGDDLSPKEADEILGEAWRTREMTNNSPPQPPRRLLRVADLTQLELERLLDLAAEIKVDPLRLADSQHHRLLACIFERPSTRTRLAFAAAAYRLGMHPMVLSSTDLQLGRGEPIADTARAISAYVAAVVIRTASHELIDQFARAASVPVVNALSDEHHPCEAIAALMTIRERFGRLKGLKVAYVGDGNNVATSLVEAAVMAGMRVAVASPPGYGLPARIVAEAEFQTAQSGGDIAVTTNKQVAVQGAHVVYTDAWVSMATEDEAEARRQAFEAYRVDTNLMQGADREAVFLHCLPARRGEEVQAEVIDGPRSLVWTLVANHLLTEQAIISWLLQGTD